MANSRLKTADAIEEGDIIIMNSSTEAMVTKDAYQVQGGHMITTGQYGQVFAKSGTVFNIKLEG